MKIVFVSNFLNHHQKPFCAAMRGNKEVSYCFVSTESMAKDRILLGWQEEKTPDYEVRAYESEKMRKRAQMEVDNGDVVIIGSAPDAFILNRLKRKKLTFKYAERFYKTGTPLKRWLRDAVAAWLHHGRFQRYPLYMLCASAFTAADAKRFRNYLGRCYKWGYFPETIYHEEECLFRGKKRVVPIILWAGRFLDWKHPDDVIRVAARLRKEGYDFQLKMIGDGGLMPKLRDMVAEERLDCVELLSTMKPGQVREHMEQANVYLFTSDRNEGWGAVLNESMNSGCAVVASHAIGSVPFLMKHRENGLIYRSGDVDGLYRSVKYLLDNPGEQLRMGRNAYRTITEKWNAEEAARRLPLLVEDIKSSGVSTRFADGPCSKAEIVKDNWFTDEE